jgi:ribonuclease HI
VIEKGTTWSTQIKRVTKPSWGVTPKYARKLFIGVALPKILYGAEVWYTPIPASTETGHTPRRGVTQVTKKLTSTQRAGALAITGGLRTSPTDTLDILANLIPFEQVINSWCYRAALRLASLPNQHPLKKPVTRCGKSTAKKHPSPLLSLLRIIDANPSDIGTKAISITNPVKPPPPPFRIKIPPDKESSKKEWQNATEEIQVYTDGSIIDEKVGAAAILTRPGKAHRTLHLHLGKASEYTIYDAELAGLLLGLYLIKTEKKARRRTFLGADNQAAINAIQNELSTPTHLTANVIANTARQLHKTRGDKNYSLTIRWTAGHVGIDGNELVDEEAKKAAKGQSSNSTLLPPFLRKKLKISTAALKQNHNKHIKLNWKSRWAELARGKADSRIDPNTPSKNFIDLISNSKLPRHASSTISQLRTTHVPLNRYLHRFKCVDNPRCPACGEPLETVAHFLLYCPAYAHERWALEKAIKRKPNLKTLLGDPKATLALYNFIKASHRLENPSITTR